MSVYVLSIDPGTGGTAWALWEQREKIASTLERPVQVGVCEPAKYLDWMSQMESVSDAIRMVFTEMRMKSSCQPISQAYLEWPRFMESEGGQKSANSGALVKLCVTVGAIARVILDNGCQVVPVEVNDWKGQMKKLAVVHRVQKRLGKAWCDANLKGEHMYHAVGIGLHWKGAFGG